MISRFLRAAYIVILLFAAGCADLASLLPTPTPASVPQATATPEPLSPTATASAPQIEARVLRVWLPPRLDPNLDSPSSALLQQRLADFEESHSGMQIEIRIKGETGETGLLNALSLTNAAAPATLPDLIALPRADLESAASRGLLHPMDGLSTLLDDPNWYPYARELGHIQNIGYGLPFAGNALVLIHRPELTFETWEDIFQLEGKALAFPASDPQALFALHLYISGGGRLTDDQGLPTLEVAPLTQTLTLLKTGVEAGTFSPNLSGLDTYDDSFEAYRIGQADLAATWSTYQRPGLNDVLHDIPGLNSASAFVDGWVWALAGAEAENQQVAVELAEYLMADDFLGEWARSLSYLPMRLTPANGQDVRLAAILESARPLPPRAVLEVLGPIMNQAVNRVLNGEQVEAVVRSVLDQLR